jgi:hypothetical protein
VGELEGLLWQIASSPPTGGYAASAGWKPGYSPRAGAGMKPPRSVPEAPQHLPEHPEVLSEAERAKSRKEDETVSL